MRIYFLTHIIVSILKHSLGYCVHYGDEGFCHQDEEGYLSNESLFRVKRGFSAYKTGKELTRQVSETLDLLLVHSPYDKRVRPKFGGKPVKVILNLSILSMGPVDESREVFNMDCYFRQSWTDERLKYNRSGVEGIALNWAFLAKIWVPDTVVINEKKSYLHKITVPNRFVRVSRSGRVSYSQRLTISARCPMNLIKFPLDSQICPLQFGSFGYSVNDIVYSWKKPKAASIEELGLAQFHLIDFYSSESIEVSQRRMGKGELRNDSTTTIEFVFERQTGFFLLQIYTPLTLIVFCSWVAFWLVKTEKGGEVPARTVLGATSVLSIVNIGFTGKDRPKVGYATALDVFIIICFIFVFAALIEFASINFIDTLIKWKKLQISKENPPLPPDKSDEKNEEKTDECTTQDLKVVIIVDSLEDDIPYADEDNEKERKEDVNFFGRIFKAARDFKHCVFRQTDNVLEKFSGKPLTESRIFKDTLDVIYDIDSYSRKLFPFIFLLLQIFYWTMYLYVIP